MSKSRHARFFVLAVIACALLTLGYVFLIRPSLLVLPDKNEVESATAIIDESEINHLPLFEVEPDYIPRILDELQPAKRDWIMPPPWVVLGRLTLKCKGGKIIVVDLYKTYQPEGAFSLRIDGDDSSSLVSNCFRGGNDDRIEALIKEAYQASKHHN